jgi:de-etiolated-1
MTGSLLFKLHSICFETKLRNFIFLLQISFCPLFVLPCHFQVNTVRRLYENLVPSYTIYDIDCPDYSFRKFTNDGKYLVAFSRNHQDLIVYHPIWLTYSCNEECDSHDVPPKAKKFDSFFKELYSMPLASSNEYICKDFFLYMECHQFGLFATSTAQSNDPSVTEGAIYGVPSIEKITFYLVRYKHLVSGGTHFFSSKLHYIS